MPKLYAPGALLVGDSASFLNAARIKGIHLAMKSGMLAGETAFEALQSQCYSEETMAAYKTKVDESWIHTEMTVSQNFHTDISTGGLASGSVKYGLAKIIGPGKIRPAHEDHEGMQTLQQYYGNDLSKRPKMTDLGSMQTLIMTVNIFSISSRMCTYPARYMMSINRAIWS